MRTGLWLGIAATTFAVFGFVGCQNPAPEPQQCVDCSLRPPSTSEDKSYVESAVRLWSLKSGSKPDEILQDRYARVIRLGDEVCVALHVEIGGAGEAPSYCFRSDSLDLTKRFDNVE